MEIQRGSKLRNFHQAKWDEEVIFELSTPGERGIHVPPVEPAIADSVGDGVSQIPASMQREIPPALPEVGQMRVLKHYLRLSQQNLGADLNVDVGQGTCTIKYNPKINEQIAASPKARDIHPLQDESTVQGALRVMYEVDQFLREISGMDRFSLQPSSGSHAILTMAAIMHKYHQIRGEANTRDELITTIFSHPSDAAAAAVKGYNIITLYPDEQGMPDVEALKAAISERTAGLFITNPEDVGIFNPRIAEFTRTVHDAGGICGYDQANANGIMGITRARDADFDLCFFNMHKTFAAPHGCGGPAAGAVGATEEMAAYLPVPLVGYDGERYFLDYDVPQTIGKARSFYGAFPVILKSYAWILSMGAEGLKEAARVAVLNNNYLLKKICEIDGATSPYSGGKRRIEQVRYSWEELYRATGIDTHDVTLRMADFGFHLWSSHHPFVVPQPFTIEPTESYSKEELDEYLDGLRHVAQEARTEPETVKRAPHNSVVHKIDESSMDDPAKWAVTWRAYLKKHGEAAASIRV
ncbi:MAG: aminomethyl-transferring glycine dehydrogenase subunit GcvPB [Gemmatimonadota bacterium]|nr:MAG: aminomethyl-transferring glycine dehydrogenase subunit GcvPB [Gemmatimonadota bacterium]